MWYPNLWVFFFKSGYTQMSNPNCTPRYPDVLSQLLVLLPNAKGFKFPSLEFQGPQRMGSSFFDVKDHRLGRAQIWNPSKIPQIVDSHNVFLSVELFTNTGSQTPRLPWVKPLGLLLPFLWWKFPAISAGIHQCRCFAVSISHSVIWLTDCNLRDLYIYIYIYTYIYIYISVAGFAPHFILRKNSAFAWDLHVDW